MVGHRRANEGEDEEKSRHSGGQKEWIGQGQAEQQLKRSDLGDGV